MDDYGDDARDFGDTTREVGLERSRVLLGYDGMEQDDKGYMNYVFLHSGYTMDTNEFKVPKPPDEWFDPSPNTAKGEPTFEKVARLDGWSNFPYHPVFADGAQGGQYLFHCLPAVFQPVLPNEYDAAISTHGGCIFSTNGGRRRKTMML